MKPGRATPPEREVTTVEPGSKSVSRPDLELKPPQTPITQPEPGPKVTATAQPASKTHQPPSTPHEAAPQQRPLTQQETLAQQGAESQQEISTQQNSALQQKLLAPQEPAPQQSAPMHWEPSSQEEAASQQGPGPGKESETQQEPEMREAHVAQPEPGPAQQPPAQQEAGSTPPSQPRPGPKNGSPVQTESIFQERLRQSDPIAQQRAPARGAKSQLRSLTEWGFLSKLHQISAQRPASEWRTFYDWVTDSDSEPDVGSPLKSSSSAKRSGTVAQGMKLAFKGKHELASGYGGTSAHGKKTGSQNHRHYRDTGEFEAKELNLPEAVIHSVKRN